MLYFIIISHSADWMDGYYNLGRHQGFFHHSNLLEGGGGSAEKNTSLAIVRHQYHYPCFVCASQEWCKAMTERFLKVFGILHGGAFHQFESISDFM